MQPSSLIFVVVIGIWAAFLVQYWVRRREHLATARSVDHFSEAMRVLDRRSHTAQMSAAAGGRSGEPDAAGGLGGSDTPAALRSRPSSLLSGVSRRSPLVARGPAPQLGASSEARREPDVSRRPVPEPGGATRRAVRRRPSSARRRMRALALLMVLATVPATIAAVTVGLIPPWAVAIACAGAGLCLLALRLAAVRALTARHTARSMRSPVRGGSAGPHATSLTDAGTALALRPDRNGTAVPERHSGDAAELSTGVGAAGGARPVSPAYRPGDPTWNPVPVPRPTYQLKDPALPVRRVRTPRRHPFDGQEAEQHVLPSGPSRRVVSG